MWSLFFFKKRIKAKTFKGSAYEEKFKDRAKSREILENKGSCWGRGRRRGHWCLVWCIKKEVNSQSFCK